MCPFLILCPLRMCLSFCILVFHSFPSTGSSFCFGSTSFFSFLVLGYVSICLVLLSLYLSLFSIYIASSFRFVSKSFSCSLFLAGCPVFLGPLKLLCLIVSNHLFLRLFRCICFICLSYFFCFCLPLCLQPFLFLLHNSISF